MKYAYQNRRRRWSRGLFVACCLLLVVAGGIAASFWAYYANLKPVSSSQEVISVTVAEGAAADAIAQQLKDKGLIRSEWAFKLYVSNKGVRNALQAGTYDFMPSQGVAEIVAQLSHGKITTELITILPGKRIDQIRSRLIQEGFAEQEVAAALDPAAYAGHPALADKPAEATLEGYLYPDSYQRSNGNPRVIITAALDEMNKHLTAELRAGFAKQGLTTYQGIILASIVEKEVSKQEDREQVAQVFLKRLAAGIRLQSDATTSYGAILDGKTPVSGYDSPYNTYTYAGLPPSPISNVGVSSLLAVAQPATTDWLYFVSGDDGATHFSTTLSEHESNVQQYCTKQCGQ